jgi:hypothetical protein
MNLLSENSRNEVNNKLQGYPYYPAHEDIYKQFLEERNIDPEDIANANISNKGNHAGESNINDPGWKISGDDLDVPGSELDDAQESIGSEDEENNFYSLGGDDHSNLDEN